MKILQVVSRLTKGGAERMVVDLSNALSARGHEVSLLAATPENPELLQNALDGSVNVRFLRSGCHSVATYVRLVPWMLRHWRWISDHDIVHCHLSFGSAFGTAVAAKRKMSCQASPAVVETYHAVGAPLPRFHNQIHQFLASTHDGLAIIASDPSWARFARRHPGLPTEIIPNGVAFERQAPSADDAAAYRRLCGIPPDVLVLGTVGRLVSARRPQEVMAVVGQAARVLPQLHFLWAGEGECRDWVAAEAERLGLAGRVHLPGLVLRPHLAFANIDLYLSLNVGEITGIAGLEAAAAACPIVAIQADDTYQPQPDDWCPSSSYPEPLADLCVDLLQSGRRRAELAARQNAYVVANHGVAPMTDAYLAFYDRVKVERLLA